MLKPEITHLGHAGFTVSGSHGVLLIDPWFHPAFLESWFPWPDNRHMAAYARGNWIYVSHHHEDHFDETFLRQILGQGGEPRIIVPRFRSRRMERLWKSVGAKPGQLRVLGHGDELELSEGVTVTMLLDRSHKEDSALLVDYHGYRFLDANDCELASCDIPRAHELACQFSGAVWYPHCYDYTANEYLLKAAQVKRNNIDRLYHKMERTQAMTYRPSAGPAAFLDSSLMRYNAGESHGLIFPQWRDVEGQFLRRFPRVRIGGYLPVTESIENYAERRLDDWQKFYDRDDASATTPEIAAHFAALNRANGKLLEGYSKDVRFSAIDGAWTVRVGALSAELEEDFNPSYWVTMPRRVLRGIVNGDVTWESALSSMRCELHREPDDYDFTLMSLLAYGDEPAITAEIARNRDHPDGERITRDGWDLPRWCPHAGEDLRSAGIAGDTLTCSRHGWAWNLTTGECVDGDQNVKIKARRIE